MNKIIDDDSSTSELLDAMKMIAEQLGFRFKKKVDREYINAITANIDCLLKAEDAKNKKTKVA